MKNRETLMMMETNKTSKRIFTRCQIENLLSKTIGHTLEEVDYAGLFVHHAGREKVKGIAGDIIEISVLGCDRDSKQEPDIVVDGVQIELKTTGVIKPKKAQSPYLYECKEPVSVTAVSIQKIIHEEFDTSNFWHKLAHMLWVYYWYNSPVSVKLDGYKFFPILGFQFYEFSEDDRLRLRQDWLLVRDFLIMIHHDYSSTVEREAQYPRLSHELRSQLMLIDTAPKYPNPPRFRLKRSFATIIADKCLSKRSYEKLQMTFSKYADIDEKCQALTTVYSGKSFLQIAAELGLDTERNMKNFAEQAVVKMFGGHVSKLNQIEDFAKIGLIAKSVPLEENGKGKEDMKLFLPNLTEWVEEEAFEDSSLYEYFTGHHFLFIIYHYTNGLKTPENIIFDGFKRVYFDDAFINSSVKKLWDDVRNLIKNKELKIVRETDKDGNFKLNPTGSYREAPNFPKKATHPVFIRGGASTSEEKNKTLVINGLRMMPQYVWLSRNVVLEMTKK